MHIFVDAAPLHEKQRTGVATYIFNLLRTLAKLDMRNEYTILSIRLDQGSLGITNDNFKIRTVPDLLKFLPPWYSWTLWYYTGLPVQLYCSRPDVFLSGHPVLPVLCPHPSLVVVYDLTPLVHKDAYSTRFRFTFGFWVRHAVKRADKIITISQSTKNDLINLLKVKAEKISVIYPGYDDVIFTPSSDQSRIQAVLQRYGIVGSYILYVGSLEPKKNIRRLIEAFASLKRHGRVTHKLVITGKRVWGDEIIFQEVTRNGLEGQVIFTGYMPLEDIPLLVSGADAFVFPSLHEGFGIPPLEAMACGTPVITSSVASLPEVVGDAGLLVNPYSVDEIAEAIYRVVSDKNLQEQMRRNGLKRAKMFSWEMAAREILKTIEETYRSWQAHH